MSARRWLRPLGLTLSLLAVAWIVWRFLQTGGTALLDRVSIAPLALGTSVLAGAAAYAVAMCLPAIAWWRLLAGLSRQDVPATQTIATYAVSQYGKYLPGNVAHYALRHAWSRRRGVPHGVLGLASVLEAALLLLAALMLMLTADIRDAGTLPSVDPRILVMLLLAGLLAAWLGLTWLRQRGRFPQWTLPPIRPAMLATCLLCYLGFFVLCAALQTGLAHVLGDAVTPFARLLAAGAASWLAGFVVVGAPAGLGVREVVFVSLMGASLGERNALLLIGVFRGVTFLGDTLLLGAGSWLLHADERRSSSARSCPIEQPPDGQHLEPGTHTAKPTDGR